MQANRKILTGHNIVYFGPEKWDGLWRNRHQLMSRFARHNKVLYVEPKRYLQAGHYHRANASSCRWNFRTADKEDWVTQLTQNLYIYHGPIFTRIFRRFPLKKITFRLWKLVLRLTMWKMGFDSPIVWLSHPSMANLIKSFRGKLLIYHVVDEYKGYCCVSVNTTRRKQLEALEPQMLNKADMVIVVSKNLLESKLPFNKHTYLVPNGVDYEAYDRALQSDGPLPSDIARLPGPVIGYSGLISARLDLGLLQHIASSHPDWSVALMGVVKDNHCAVELRRLKKMRNVYFLGTKEVDHIPCYLKAFDICLVPYRLSEETQNADPLKLYEYMAVGKPIVTTSFPAAQQFQHIVRIADSKDEFIRHIEDALSATDELLFLKSRQIAAENTWEDRLAQLSWLIESRLEHIQ